ncbi:S9 family peptidase [Streptomyces boncukensis]|uniref:S9 family peptidase n=1 Tax=Streptomyces boncukensis TaxID=2711219 RepID=A0A6G4X2L3_9ACTN|nr:alpha/beta fold hydrolase [Streptomyces boncukensis]NGO71779.1 S9 family peptidase [Streptomyces boncukensis]
MDPRDPTDPAEPAEPADPSALAAFPRQLARTRRFTLGAPRDFALSPGGERVLFLRSRGGADPACCLWLREGGAERVLADPVRLGAPPDGPGIAAYSADAHCRTAVFALGGQLWATGTGPGPGSGPTDTLRPLTAAEAVTEPRIDPTGQRVAYVARGALHVVELADGAARVLAAPDGPEVTYGLAEYVAGESMHRPYGFWWAPDGRRLLAARVDCSAVRRWWIADPAHPEREPRAIRYPAAGTANADVSLHILPVAGGGARTEVRWDRHAFEYLASAVWDAHGPLLSVQSRDQRTLRVLAADPGTGATAVLHEQRDPAWVELVPGAPLRTAAGALVHVLDERQGPDDRDGTRRLAVDGEPVTPHGLQIRELLGTVGEDVYVAAGDEPTEQHVWRCDARRGAVERVSEGPGVHTARTADGALLLVSHTEDGRRCTLAGTGPDRAQERTAIRSYEAEPLVVPRPMWLRAGPRGIRTALLLPSWHTPGERKLPVLMSPYGGPAMQLVRRVRGWWFCVAQWFAEHGFAVLVADGRGTPGRGPGWEKAVHGDTLTAVIEDQVAALHAAAGHCRDLDPTRVGIRGWSFGGTLAAAAVLRRPDVFHAAVSGAAPSDQRLYDTHWRERFLGLPEENPEAYARSSPLTDAASLTRPLLLVHGLADDNVAAAHTLRMSAALLAAGRPHRVLPLSGAGHRPYDETTVARLLTHELEFLRETCG